MSYHYGSSSSSSTPSNARQTTVNAQGLVAPPGFHYMPDGTLMSDIEHARTYGGGTIKTFDLDTTNIKASGEKRKFTVTGDGTFSLMIKNESNNYYNFTTNKFQTANTRLANVKLQNTYSGNISFPVAPTTTDVVNGAVTSGVKVVMDNNVATKMEVGDRVTGNAALNAANVTVVELSTDSNAKKFSMSEAIAIADDAVLIFTGSDQYDVFLFAENGTQHANYSEARFDDNSIDINSSTGSDSLLLRKVIYQTLDIRLTFSGGILTNTSVPAGFSSLSNNNRTIISAQIGASTGKIPFSFEIEAGSTHSFKVDRNPTMSDVCIKSTRTIGNYVQIEGEDISGSTAYRWSVDNVDGLTSGMLPVGTNITAGSLLSSYEEVITSMSGTITEQKYIKTRKEAVEKTGSPTLTRDTGTKALTTVQTGNVVFNKQQAAALASDEITIVGFGQNGIKSLTGWDIELTDIITTLTKPTALVTTTTVNSTTVAISNADGIMSDVSTVSSINMNASAANPTVTNIASYSGSTATLTLSSAQSLEAGETLTFDGAARKITISGNLRVISAGSSPAHWDGILGFDLEKFITATDETS